VDVAGFSVDAEPGSFPLATEYAQFAVESFPESFTNFPNPFAAGRQTTTFSFYLPQAARVTLRIYTPRGESVRTLLEDVSAGEGLEQSFTWDGRNGEGDTVRNGVYVAELVAVFTDGKSERLTRKLAVVR
jgi:flagellar hook assembly protein FlgD